MKIFISWSGDTSKAIASTFKEWIPAVIQAAKPYFSPSDIEKGARWSVEIASELESSRIGLICLTAENLNAPWIMFEAGALSKSLDKSRVCPMLFGVHPTDLSGPLVQFQAASFSKDEVLKFVKVVNSQLPEDTILDSSVLDSVFQKWWPELDEKIQKILAIPSKKTNKEIRSDRDLLEEVLKLTRALSATNLERDPLSSDRMNKHEGNSRTNVLVDQLASLADVILAKAGHDIDVLKACDTHLISALSFVMSSWPVDKQRQNRMSKIWETIQERINEYEELPF